MKTRCCYRNIKNTTILILALMSMVLASSIVLADGFDFSACFGKITNATCTAANCNWKTDPFGFGNFCKPWDCFDADGTSEAFCESLNNTYNLPFNCTWTDSGSFCDPVGGSIFGASCADFDTLTECASIPFCDWDGSSCIDGDDQNFDHNPTCKAIGVQDTCLNISGCSWDSEGFCTNSDGSQKGIQCSALNKSICGDFTLLESCCSWNGTGCTVSYDQSCYSNVPTLPSGEQFCEDTIPFKNQTSCEKLAGAPFYMPCKWNNVTSNCQFNDVGFGGGTFATYDEIPTQKGCEAQGGLWKTEQFTVGTKTKTDSWCEFKFGGDFGGGNCASACWACENDASPENACATSALGYCQWTNDTYAHNGVGWCNPKQNFIDGGGKNCQSACSGCDFLNNPENACATSPKGCDFVNDSTAPNGVGFCYGKSEKRCNNDCFSCYDQTLCTTKGNGGNGACSWDANFYYCKPVGYTDEVCFDGIDNDNDAKIDCADSGCATDKFCGGASLDEQFGDCHSNINNNTCADSGCVWIQDDFQSQFGEEPGFASAGVLDAQSIGFCDFPGAQCWQHDENSTACTAESGCSYITTSGGFCGENDTLFDTCFAAQNSTACTSNSMCGWNSGFGFGGGFGSGGWCEPLIFAQCFGNQSRQVSQAACEENVSITTTNDTQVCAWVTDPFGGHGSGGWCEAVCFSTNNNSCENSSITSGLCKLEAGLCEPDSFGGNCFGADGNQTGCNGKLNGTCTYFPDPFAGNAVNASEPSGWCDPKNEIGFIKFMGDIVPTTLGQDTSGDGANATHDIEKIYIKDDFDKWIFGTEINDNFMNSSTCNKQPKFNETDPGMTNGTLNYTFFWYIDADGNTTNNCAARNNASQIGYEFSMTYKASWNGEPNATATSSLTQTKVAFQCVNGSWGPVPIPLISNEGKMCDVIEGGMTGIDKKELFKFKTKFNKTADLRIYAVVTNTTKNDSTQTDEAGPYYYGLGSFDFHFEDCSNPGGDADGDGLTASNDPDCNAFNKFGYVPQESGFECGDGIDNDADGKTDCTDDGCKFDVFACGGSLTCTPGDNKPPKVNWLQATSFPDAAFIMYDTNEPSNGTVTFYNQDNNCSLINKTIRDWGIFDTFVPAFKLWHDAPIDNFNWNPENIGSNLPNGTTLYYKTTVCDLCNNCAVSACLNFSTKASAASCKSCTSTFNFPFTPKSGSSATDPLGDIQMKIETPDGVKVNLSGNAASGAQLNYTQTKNFDLSILNPNSSTNWTIKLVNASITGKVSTGIQNFSANNKDIGFNDTTNGTFLGFGSKKCQQLINTFRPKVIEISVPGNHSELWQCDSGLTNCSNKTSNATLIGFNDTFNYTIWQTPAEWGC